MSVYDPGRRPPGRPLADWVGRLADRLTGLKAHVRGNVVEAAGRTVAEAAEAALRRLFAVGRPPDPAPHWAHPGWGPADDPDDPWDAAGRDGDLDPAPRRTLPRWSWRAVAVAGLHTLAWWLRRAPSPFLAAAATVAGAALLLLD